MKRTIHLFALTGVMLFTGAALQAAQTKPSQRPNVIVLLTDDNGYGDHACLGNPVLKTPNFDRLHRQSVRLTDFHVDYHSAMAGWKYGRISVTIQQRFPEEETYAVVRSFAIVLERGLAMGRRLLSVMNRTAMIWEFLRTSSVPGAVSRFSSIAALRRTLIHSIRRSMQA
jgi:hypothetical protein